MPAGLLVQPPPSALHRPTSACSRASLYWMNWSRAVIQRSLCFEQGQKVARSRLVTRFCAFECALALRDIFNLKFSRLVQVMDCAQGVFDVDQRCDDRRAISQEQLLFLCLRFIALGLNRPWSKIGWIRLAPKANDGPTPGMSAPWRATPDFARQPRRSDSSWETSRRARRPGPHGRPQVRFGSTISGRRVSNSDGKPAAMRAPERIQRLALDLEFSGAAQQ